jgi:hypothetical protein
VEKSASHSFFWGCCKRSTTFRDLRLQQPLAVLRESPIVLHSVKIRPGTCPAGRVIHSIPSPRRGWATRSPPCCSEGAGDHRRRALVRVARVSDDRGNAWLRHPRLNFMVPPEVDHGWLGPRSDGKMSAPAEEEIGRQQTIPSFNSGSPGPSCTARRRRHGFPGSRSALSARSSPSGTQCERRTILGDDSPSSGRSQPAPPMVAATRSARTLPWPVPLHE